MNAFAVTMGLAYALLSAVVCYVVSLLASGLFSRRFYRLYARVLIGICCAMMLAPPLRFIASADAVWATAALTLAQYIVMAVLGYGVFRFNREYMKKVFLRRSATAYFTFGTLANATIVTLAMLHVAVVGAPDWHLRGPGFLAAANYGPLLVLLAALVFHTDNSLKLAKGSPRRFGWFTFIGYAVAFVGIGLSLAPQLGFTALENRLLQNVFSGQTLAITIVVFAWMVLRYESIPPLFVMLLAMIAEYHVLVTQWVTEAYGFGSLGLVSLPLLAGIFALDHYFARWDRRKSAKTDGKSITQANGMRFVMPFRTVSITLSAVIFAVTMATCNTSPRWFVATCWAYAIFFIVVSARRKEPKLVYVSGLFAGCATILGSSDVMLLAGTAVFWASAASVGRRFGARFGLKSEWRTSLTDCGLLSAAAVVCVVASRHFLGSTPFYFQNVDIASAITLVGASLAFFLAARQYRSWLPVFAGMLALVVITPIWTAGLGLLSAIAANAIQQRFRGRNGAPQDLPLKLFRCIPLSYRDATPGLFVTPLSVGAVPLALIGLISSAIHVLHGDFSSSVVFGAIVSAIVLLLLTRTLRAVWLYDLGLAATFFAVSVTTYPVLRRVFPSVDVWSTHLFISSVLCFVLWAMASGYAGWCRSLINRVAEADEDSWRQSRAFYSGNLFHVISAATTAILIAAMFNWFSGVGDALWSLGTFASASILFAMAAARYRTQLWTPLALTAFSLCLLTAIKAFDLHEWDGSAVQIGLGAAIASVILQSKFQPSRTPKREPWLQPISLFSASGLAVWIKPLAVYAIACSLFAVVRTLHVDFSTPIIFHPSLNVPYTCMIAGFAFVVCTRVIRSWQLYAVGLTLIGAAVHIQVGFMLSSGEIGGNTLTVQLLTATGIAFLTCLSGAAAGLVLHRFSPQHSDRKLFAGTTVLFGCVVGIVATAGLACMLPTELSDARFAAVACTLLVFTGLLVGKIYRSRIAVYFATVTFVMALHFGFVEFGSLAQYDDWRNLLVAGLACLGSIVAWRLNHLQQEPPGRVFAFWQSKSTPLFSDNTRLWSEPLTNSAIVLTGLAIWFVMARCLHVGTSHPAGWMMVLPLLLVSAVWFVASSSRRASWFAAEGGITEDGITAGWRERGVWVVLSMLMAGLALQFTLHLVLNQYGLSVPGFDRESSRATLSWHLQAGAGMSLFVWVAATLYSTVRRNPLSDESKVYAGLPQIVAAIAALLNLVLVGSLAFVSVTNADANIVSPLFLGTSLTLALFFGLVGCSFRTQLGSYLSLIAMAFAAIHAAPLIILYTAVFLPLQWQVLPCAAVSLSVLALGISLAAAMISVVGARFERTIRLPTTWPAASMPMRVSTVSQAWQAPLGNLAVVFSAIGLLLAAALVQDQQFLAALVAAGCIACSFAITAIVQQRPALTYGAALTTAMGIPVVFRFVGWPISDLGIGLAVLAIALWAVGFAAKRLSNTKVELVNVCEQPLIRFSVALAVASVAHAVFVWVVGGWEAAQQPLVVATCLSAVTLLLTARTLSVLHRDTWAKLMVYLGCASLTGCLLFAYAMTSETLNNVLPIAGLIAVALALLGSFALAGAPAIESAKSSATTRRVFGQPVLRFAIGLAICAMVFWFLPLVLHNLGTLTLTGFCAAVVFVLATRSERSVLWLHAAIVTAAISFLLLVRWQTELSLGGLTLVALLQLNLLLVIGNWFGRQPSVAWKLFRLSSNSCQSVCGFWPKWIGCGVLIGQVLLLQHVLRIDQGAGQAWPWAWVGLFSAGLFSQLLVAKRSPIYGHLLAFSGSISVVGISLLPGSALTPDVSIAILGMCIGLLAAALNHPVGRAIATRLRLPSNRDGRKQAERLTAQWSFGLLSCSLAITLPAMIRFQPVVPTVSIVLLITTIASLGAGLRWRRTTAAVFATMLLPLGVASACLFYQRQELLLQYTGLAAATNALFLFAVSRFIGRKATKVSDFYWRKLSKAIEWPSMVFGAIALVHFAALTGVAATGFAVTGATEESLAALAAIILASGYWLWIAWRKQIEATAYVGVVASVVTVFYFFSTQLGMKLLSSSPSAFLLIGCSFVLYAANAILGRSRRSAAAAFLRPTYCLALGLPVLLAITIQHTDRSAAAFVLLAAGAFYLIVTYQSRTRWTVYAAAFLLNFAVYLWIPVARDLTGLYQLYVIPAAVTVLIFAQLHRRELQPQVLSSIRLASTGAILAVATLEVFFVDGATLLQFVSVLALSLIGTIAGIALRIKPFVYMGLAFLVLNVVGQLGLKFQHEDGILRAIILIAVGLLVLSAMIFFNVHRERILQQYRSFVASKEWE